MTLDHTEKLTNSTEAFLSKMRHLYKNLEGKQPQELYDLILAATIVWNNTEQVTSYVSDKNNKSNTRHRRTLDKSTGSTMTDNNSQGSIQEDAFIEESHLNKHSIQEDIAHAFHLASIAILGIIVFEVSMAFW